MGYKLDGKNENCQAKSFTVATKRVNEVGEARSITAIIIIHIHVAFYLVDSFQNLVGSPCRGTGNGPY